MRDEIELAIRTQLLATPIVAPASEETVEADD